MLRFFIVRNHYRSPQNYAPDNLVDTQQSLDRLYQTLQNVPCVGQVDIDWDVAPAVAFRAAMDDDFNTAGAVAVLFDLATQANRDKDALVSGQLKALAAVLGLLQQDPLAYFQSPTRYTRRAIDEAVAGQPVSGAVQWSEAEIESMIQARATAKQSRDFAQADQIRATLRSAGVELDDKPGGQTQWRRA